MAPNFPRGSTIRRVNAEPAISLMAGRALLLQIAHPAVAQGVEDHSEFRRNPFKRLQGTLEAVYTIVFGSQELAAGVGRRLHWIHEHITGPTYRANDPANLMWVHATLMDSALMAQERWVRELSDAEREEYYQQMKRVPATMGLAVEDQPATLADFREYFDRTVAEMHVTDVGRDLARFIMTPRLPLGLHVPFAPVLSLFRLVTTGVLPPSIRDQLGLRLSERAERRLAGWDRVYRTVFGLTPRPVRAGSTWVTGRWLLWLAARHVHQFDERMSATATH